MNKSSMEKLHAMREACQKMLDLLMLRGDGKVQCVLTWDEFNDSQKMLRDAIAMPMRNCDRFADWKSAFSAFYDSLSMPHPAMSDGVSVAFLNWLFAKAENSAEVKKEIQ